ncbi:PaaI family thioesterase [Actinocrinis puniceicyclus]|uniref:PaaI family thioesterase n=1 Tax=Actinocrinis puniceicyclus TaxID=977794 RepID=A0A8J7WRS5_9ACTN|nr:PaaI family thioesterase [Actinocrinis puniceicyclus]MBS2966333.1 PaaI family thioesterase [Actinocrinis puniceicyclus]
MTEAVRAAQSAEPVGPRGRAPDGSGVRERSFTWADPLETAGFGAGLSGMEFFAAMADGRVPAPPIMQTLDFSGFTYVEGRVSVRLTPQEFHYNPLGSVHGGVFAALLDTVCGCAVHTRLPAGVFYTSLDLSVKFLRPVSIETGTVTAEGSVVHLGRRTALADARIFDAHGKVYATATSSCLIMRPE